MNHPTRLCALALVLFAMCAGTARNQTGEFLTPDEQDKLRDAQDPSTRIEVYIALQQSRLERFEEWRKNSPDPQYDIGSSLDGLLDEYVALDDELKNWIDDQFQRNGDMRRGLRVLLDRGSKQLEELHQIEQTPDPFLSDYRENLRNAIDDLTDTLDGGTKALEAQDKKFKAMKQNEKAEVRTAKGRAKEEKKRTEEEKKLRKKEHKKRVPADSDSN